VVRTSHRDWWIVFLERAESGLHGPQQKAWFDRFEEEHENFRAALQWCAEQRNPEAGLRLTGAMGWFWYIRGYPSEGRSLLQRFLSMPAAVSGAIRGKALNRAGLLAWHQGDYTEATALCEEGLRLAQDSANKQEGFFALHVLGSIAFQPHADYRTAREMFEQQLDMARSAPDRWGEAVALHNLGRVHWRQGDYVRAARQLEESLAIFAEIGDTLTGTAWALHSLGLVARSRGDYAQAGQYHAKCLELFRELGERPHYALAVNNLGVLARQEGDYSRAAAMCEDSVALFREIGDKGGVALAQYSLGLATMHQGDLARAETLCRDSLSQRLELDDHRAIAESLEALAFIAAAQRQFERAATLYGAGDTIRARLGAPVPASDREEYDRTVAGVRAALGARVFAAAWSRGRTLTTEQVASYAIGKDVLPKI
jgi:tetratricopeptide (TPR) repeat protein